MAIDFDALNSKLEHLTATGFNVATYTILFWFFADTTGEGTDGAVISLDETANAVFLSRGGLTDGFQFIQAFSTTNGVWIIRTVTDGQWNACALSYNRGDVANDPVGRINFAAATITETTTPVGTATSPFTGYCIGNVTGQTNTWDGGLMHFFFHNVILTDVEMDKQLRYPGSVTNGGILWAPMLNQNYTKTFTVSAGRWIDDGVNPTGTALGARSNTGLNCLVSRKLISIPKRLRIAA